MIVVDEKDKETALENLNASGEKPVVLGKVVNEEGLTING